METTVNSQLNSEQKRSKLKPEFLSTLTLDEYIALWRELNPYFLSHVTRQGFRDHNAMVYHSAGLDEFHNGFVNIMQDGRLLRPPIVLSGLRNRDKDSVKQWLICHRIFEAENIEQAKKRLDNLLNYSLASAPKYPDKNAVHFAAQIVADDYYGGEVRNEIFFIFPSDVLASQYPFAFNGWEKDFRRPQSERKWNDVFLWPQNLEDLGISIDMGIVFLPKNTLVDPETGSKYASEIRVVDGKKKRVVIEGQSLVDSFISWGLKELNLISKNASFYRDKDPNYVQILFNQLVIEIHNLGFAKDASESVANEIINKIFIIPTFTEELLMNILRDTRANWQRPKNTIPAEKYWEGFFSKNPHLRPAHVVYYDGDPTDAVDKFLIEHGIKKDDFSPIDDPLLGFGDNYVSDMNNDPRANVGYRELMLISERIIEEYYLH